mmetsp:Transcript_35636/g.65332  ORF Transcript_35636/g.65332 Transcript_35636/m.65332 type:complete len:287 (+) Transcript_35636:3136-3996(+)
MIVINDSLEGLHIPLCDGIRVGREYGAERHAGCGGALGEGAIIVVLSDAVKFNLVLLVDLFHDLEALTQNSGMCISLCLQFPLPCIQLVRLSPQPLYPTFDVLAFSLLQLQISSSLVSVALVVQFFKHLLQLRVGVLLRQIVLSEQLLLLLVDSLLCLHVIPFVIKVLSELVDLREHLLCFLPGCPLLFNIVVANFDFILNPRDFVLAVFQLLTKPSGRVLVAIQTCQLYLQILGCGGVTFPLRLDRFQSLGITSAVENIIKALLEHRPLLQWPRRILLVTKYNML